MRIARSSCCLRFRAAISKLWIASAASWPPSDARTHVAATRNPLYRVAQGDTEDVHRFGHIGKMAFHILDRDQPGFVVLVIQIGFQAWDVPSEFASGIGWRLSSDFCSAPGAVPGEDLGVRLRPADGFAGDIRSPLPA